MKVFPRSDHVEKEKIRATTFYWYMQDVMGFYLYTTTTEAMIDANRSGNTIVLVGIQSLI